MMSGFLGVGAIFFTGNEEIDGDKMLIRLQDGKLDRTLLISRAQLCKGK